MRARLVGSYYSPFVGGVESHMRDLAHALRRLEWDVDVVCLNDRNPRSTVCESVDGIRVHRLRYSGWRNNVVWTEPLLTDDADVLHFHGFSRPLLLRMIVSNRHRRPWLLTPHGGLAGVFTDFNVVRRTLKNAFDRNASRVLLARARKVVALTQQEADDLRDRFGVPLDRLAVYRNPLPSEALSISPGEPGSTGRFVVLARLATVKRISDLVAALASDPSLPGADIYGPEGDGSLQVRSAIARLPAGRVRLCGPVQRQEKYRVLRTALALVVPSETEANSVAALEAVAQGTPVVVSDRASAGLPEGSFLSYPVGDVGALASALRSLTPKRIAELRARQMLAREELTSTDVYASNISALYREAIADR